MTPSHIGQFEIKYELGSGGFGTVFAAVDTELRRWVAIKTLRSEISSDPAMMDRFRTEGMSLGRLNHTNITMLYGMPRVAQDVYLVMELVNGQTLDAVLRRLRRLDVQETLAIIAQAAAGLGYAHRMGVIHRDIKPSNLMLTETGVLKIMDFGIARIRGTERLTRVGLLGTYAYLAPEQFRGGEGSERSDLYSLACVVYEVLTGNIPFDASTEAEMMRGHLDMPVRPLAQVLPGIDPQIDEAVQRALAKDPAERFATVEEFSDAIGASAIERTAPTIIRDNILARVPPPQRPTTILQPPASSDRLPEYTPATDLIQRGTSQDGARPARDKPGVLRKLPALLLGGVAVCVLAGLGFVFWQSLQTEPIQHMADQSPPRQVEYRSLPQIPQLNPPTHDHDENARPPQIALNEAPPPNSAPDRLASSPAPANGTPFISSNSNEAPPPNLAPDHPASGSTPSNGSVFIASKETPQQQSMLMPPPGVPSLESMSVEQLIASGRPPTDLVAEAERRFDSGDETQIESAITVLRYVARTFHNAAAFAAMGRIYDPNQPKRPQGLQPDLWQAAQNYRAAFMEGDASVAKDRDALRDYLQQRAGGSGTEAANAAAILDRFWRS